MPVTINDDVIEFAKENNRSYEWDQNGNITEIWLPYSTYLLKNQELFAELKVLRTDLRGIVWPLAGAAKPVSENMNWNLPKLKRLYLPTGAFYKQLSFLGSFPKLTYLQIQSQDRTVQKGAGFEQCINVEKMVMFGTPDKQSWAELRTLKKLNHFVLVDDDGDFPLPGDVTTAESQLPGVKIEIVQPQDYRADISGAFKIHIETIRQRVLDLANGETDKD